MWWTRTKTVLKRIGLAVVGVQAATVASLLIVDHHRKADRKPITFPKAPPEPVEVAGSQVTIYTYGEDLYDEMLSAIEQASERIYLETYIWKGDALGKRFKAALEEAAARRGVEVYVIFDEFANLVVPRPFFHFDEAIRVQRHPLIVPAWDWWHLRNSGRNHRKLMVVDSSVAFVGGYNIGAAYATDWRDTHAKVTGDAIGDLENAFVDQWNLRPSPRRPELPEPQGRRWNLPIRVQRNLPRQLVYPIRNMYLEAIDRANERIWLTHAYFIPDDDLLAALLAAVRRGVDVSVIVPDQSNHIVADWVSRGYYRTLLRGGVRLFLYQGAMVHAKTALIDDEWVTIGTANLDRLSLIGNYEINLEVTDEDLAAKMAEVFELDLTNCRELTLKAWEARPWMVKFSEAVLKPFSPFL